MRPKFQKQSALKLYGRIIPQSGGYAFLHTRGRNKIILFHFFKRFRKLTNYTSQSQGKTPNRENIRISLNKELGYAIIQACF